VGTDSINDYNGTVLARTEEHRLFLQKVRERLIQTQRCINQSYIACVDSHRILAPRRIDLSAE
jgi:hypothetical protein